MGGPPAPKREGGAPGASFGAAGRMRRHDRSLQCSNAPYMVACRRFEQCSERTLSYAATAWAASLVLSSACAVIRLTMKSRNTATRTEVRNSGG